MKYFNLLEQKNINRDIDARAKNKKINIKLARKFGFEYFDGTRDQGYGGYKYDGRWKKISKRAKERYNLNQNSRILDVGCAKGYFVKDLCDVLNNKTIFGVDISEYAIKNCHNDVVGFLHQGDARKLPFPDNSFDAIFSINTIHNFDKIGCIDAIKEMQRVCRNKTKIFIQVDAYESEEDLALFKMWVLTAKTCLKPNEWKKIFDDLNYKGDYFWTILKKN